MLLHLLLYFLVTILAFAGTESNKWLYEEWNEDVIKLCLHLYLGLLPVNQKLVHEYASFLHKDCKDYTIVEVWYMI